MIQVTYQISDNLFSPRKCICCINKPYCIFLTQARKLETVLKKEANFTFYVRVQDCTQYRKKNW